MLLGDLGAEIIKVERRGEGDDTRAFAPPFQGDQAAYFLHQPKQKHYARSQSDLGKELLGG
jgi:crotonobetainyl-CoA:carnitine CoA-transferase CaiB-like acyl-CoA transferase